MIKYLCDRCKSNSDDLRKIYIEKQVFPMIFAYTRRFEICKKCEDKLYEWMNGGEYENSN